MALLDEEDAYRINVFDWQAAFPAVMAGGGFDAVIGNPPYIRIQTMKEWAPLEVEVYKRRYRAASQGNYDIYVVFVEKGLSLLNERGRLGYILPHKFFNSQYGAPLRGLIAEGQHLEEVVHFGDQQVFAGATTYTCLLFLNKQPQADFRFVQARELAAWRLGATGNEGNVDSNGAKSDEWNFVVGPRSNLFRKLSSFPSKLRDVAHTFVGTQTSADEVFVLDACTTDERYATGQSEALDSTVTIEIEITRAFLRGKQIRRYAPVQSSLILLCPYAIFRDRSELLSEEQLKTEYPRAWDYLTANKQKLQSREGGKFRSGNWYAFGYPKSMTLFQKPKIIVPDYNNVASFAFDTGGHFFKTGYGILVDDTLSPMYILGLLNSRLLFHHLTMISTSLRGGYFRFWTQYIEQLPIRTIDFADPADAERHTRMVALVERMLDLHKRLAAVKSPPEQQMLRTQIDATDRQIDRLVYELYGLSEEEIKIVEGSGSS
jgi:hypothetical protein